MNLIKTVNEVVEGYKIISDSLISYLTKKGMPQPHPSKEFVLQILTLAANIALNDKPDFTWPQQFPMPDGTIINMAKKEE